MKNQKELQIEKMLEVLDGFGLSSTCLDTAERYLLEGGEELLINFPKQDLSKLDIEKKKASINLFSHLLNRGKLEEALRLFKIVYQIGGSTSASVFPVQDIRYNVESNEFMKKIEPYQAVTIYAEAIAYQSYMLKRDMLKKLLGLAGNNEEVLKKAMDNWQSEYDNGKLLVYTAYFLLMKANEKNDLEKNDSEKNNPEKKELLKGIVNFFHKKEDDNLVVRERNSYLNKFEASILGSIHNLLPVNETECKQIMAYLDADQEGNLPLQGNVAQLFKKHSINEYLLTLLVGCASVPYELSYRLKSFIKLCAHGNLKVTMDAVSAFMKKNETGCFEGKFKKDFMLDTTQYIIWCAENHIEHALYYEIEQDSNAYVKAMEGVSFEVYGTLMEALKKKAPVLYEKLSEKDSEEIQRKIAEGILPQNSVRTVVLNFLMGEETVEALYPYVTILQDNRSYYYGNMRNNLEGYREAKGKDAFYKRCMTYLVFCVSGYFFYQEFKSDRNGTYSSQEIEELFQAWEDTRLSLIYQVSGAELIYEAIYQESQKKSFLEIVVTIFTRYLAKKKDEMLIAFEQAGATGRYMGICTFGANATQYQSSLLKAFSDTSKLVKEQLVSIMASHEEWEQEVLAKLKSKQSAEREVALLILTQWKKDYSEVLKEALTVEKSKKLQDMMRNLLHLEGSTEESTEGSSNKSVEEYIKEIHKGGRKKGLQWAYETPYTKVHAENGEEMTEEYMQAILLSYSSMGVPGVNKEVLPLTNSLHKAELALYMNELYDKWFDLGAEAKKKWVLYATAIHGGADIVQKLKTGINQWPENARGAIAAEAVKALALNDSPTALLIVDSISRKFKFKQIKTAASEALTFAAEQLGLTTEELSDKIVPDLGFDENMRRIFDYGERKFSVYITPALEIEILAENEKKIKNLPSPGKKDDEAKANFAQAEFKLLKKQMKETVANQKLRLESALSVERKWGISSWKNLFVRNPIMHQFAIGLIWGIYEEDKLTDTFRYMEDGSFNTEDEEEYELPDQGNIGLVHPIELSKESIDRWTEQLSDYEVLQPIVQLARTIYPLEEEEKGKKTLDRFGGAILNPLSLSGKLLGMGWYRGSVQDAGGYYTFYREDTTLSLGVELHFSGSFVGYETEDVTVYDARFYESNTIKRGSYEYDEVTEEKAIALDKVPARYFSEIVYQLHKATSSSQEKDENWRIKQ